MDIEADEEILDKLKQIENILHEVRRRVSDIEGLALVTKEGLPIASVIATSVDEDRISAMTAASLSLSEKVVSELECGTLQQLTIWGTDGLIIIRDAGPHAVLAGVASSEAKLGLILLEMKRAASALEAML